MYKKPKEKANILANAIEELQQEQHEVQAYIIAMSNGMTLLAGQITTALSVHHSHLRTESVL